MNRLEDRLRRDLQAQAEHITPLNVPPLRLERFSTDPQETHATTRRLTRRRLALRLAAVVTAPLVAAAFALAVVVLAGAAHDGTRKAVVDTAYVVKRVDSALTAAGRADIAQLTITTRGALVPGGTDIAKEWSYRGQWHSVIYSPSGHLAYAKGLSTSSVYTLISYPTRTWSRGPELGGPAGLLPGTPGCSSRLPASVVRALRAAISCVNLHMAGRQRVNGVETIELTGRDSKISATIWVSPGTYLPVRVVSRPAPGKAAVWQDANIVWLAPTAQNRAKLTVPIPAGFRQVPLTQPVGAPWKYPGGPLPKPR